VDFLDEFTLSQSSNDVDYDLKLILAQQYCGNGNSTPGYLYSD